MVHSFEGKVALVTGAGSGIGRATALAFAQRGSKVALADSSLRGGQGTLEMIGAMGREAVFIRTDVSRSDEVRAMVEQAVTAYGRLDFAFNNAGILGDSARTHECTEENWDRVISVNLRGVWLCMRCEIPHMLKQGSGAIVNTASADALVGDPGVPAYAASKGGVLQLTRTAALEYAKDNVRINAICPGTVHTPMIDRLLEEQPETEAFLRGSMPIGRFAEPEEVAEAVVWLCSDAASFVVGHALSIDGGLVAQ